MSEITLNSYKSLVNVSSIRRYRKHSHKQKPCKTTIFTCLINKKQKRKESKICNLIFCCPQQKKIFDITNKLFSKYINLRISHLAEPLSQGSVENIKPSTKYSEGSEIIPMHKKDIIIA
jgi:hypothetical protein